jgi:hypothetical protein
MKRTGACRIERLKYSLITRLSFFFFVQYYHLFRGATTEFLARDVSQYEPRVQRQSFVCTMGAVHLAKLQD